jgi:hypothetical protein
VARRCCYIEVPLEHTLRLRRSISIGKWFGQEFRQRINLSLARQHLVYLRLRFASGRNLIC